MEPTTSTTARDELAQIITGRVHEGLLSYDACTPHTEIEEATDEILAAGYRKPRIVTTPEQVAGLPTGAVILSALGEVLRAYEGERLGWIETDSTTPVDDHEVDLPATVLWEPEA